MEAFATVEDLEQRWRPLSDDERKRAAVAIEDATAFIASQADTDRSSVGVLRAVCCAVAKRQMMPSAVSFGGQEMEPLKQLSYTGGPYTLSGTPVNPTGDMYLTSAEKGMLGVGSCSAFFIEPLIGES